MTLEIINFGCRLNIYEGEVMRARAEEAGLESAIIFNSCAVTAEAERQVRQAIRKARRDQPGSKIIVTGCAAQIHPDAYAAMPEVDHVLGNQEKLESGAYRSVIQLSEKALVNDIMSVKETAGHLMTSFEGKENINDKNARANTASLITGFQGRARAFVQVQNGCDHRCTFCIIPFGRGNSRSVPVGEVVSQIRALVEAGFQEVVLTGVDVSDYGKGLPGSPTLGGLIKRVLKLVPELPRLRLSSIDAVEVDADLLALMANEPRLMPHLHISLQAGDDMVLKRMKRRHSRKDIVDFCAHVRNLRPDVVFGADIIAGFPTETEEMFENTLALVDEAALTYLHVFPYSARSGTPAAKMPQVEKAIRKERAARLRVSGEKQLAHFLQSQVGKTVSILMEKEHFGHSEHFAPVKLQQAQAPGRIVSARIVRAENGALRAELHGELQAVCA